jgi:hypothetical protein
MNAREVRAAFIYMADHSDLPALRRTPRGRVLDQNKQCADIRMAFVDFVDACARNGDISERVARAATL